MSTDEDPARAPVPARQSVSHWPPWQTVLHSLARVVDELICQTRPKQRIIPRSDRLSPRCIDALNFSSIP
jgi:hypothetical protein